MLEHFSIFTKSGIVLWSRSWAPLKPIRSDDGGEFAVGPIEALIASVLLPERAGDTSYNVGPYALKWSLQNDLRLVFVAVYQKVFPLLFVDELLERVKEQFSKLFLECVSAPRRQGYSQFDAKFTHIYEIAEAMAQQEHTRPKLQQHPYPGKDFRNTGAKASKTTSTEGASSGTDSSSNETSASASSNTNGGSDDPDKTDVIPTLEQQPQPSTAAPTSAAEIRKRNVEAIKKGQQAAASVSPETAKLAKLMAPSAPRGKGPKKYVPKGGKLAPISVSTTKKPRKWEDQHEEGEFDIQKIISSKAPAGTGTSTTTTTTTAAVETVDVSAMAYNMDLDTPESDGEEETEEAPSPTKKTGGVWGFLTSLTTAKVLTDADIQPVLVKFQEHLRSKNVANEVSQKLCESVAASLVGQKIGTFQGVYSTVKQSLSEALTRILTPKRRIDILQDIDAHKKATGGAPYVMIFMGVNGVGKSTNLAKIGSWLKHIGKNVMFAACDTFRCGAVEQLKVHSNRLQIPLFEQGYGKDDANLARQAIIQAQSQGMDVVLIDTAGRMEDNENLMRGISKLVNTVEPNLVLFVGEALVGNSGVHQLVKFNEALSDFAGVPHPRLIDGIILTKFDTIDDKVGAAISMVYSTGVPIVFLGTGQHYNDLKVLNVAAIVHTLLR